jgi:hypothetical protein
MSAKETSYHGFFWTLERLFFTLENQPFSEEVLEVWKGQEIGLLRKYGEKNLPCILN